MLIVDDVEANLSALEALLQGLDCTVTRAASGNAALMAMLRKKFAVVLLDANMPEMNGFEVAQHARMNPDTRDVPIIFLTAHSAEEFALRGYDSGAVDFLSKPFNPHILRSKVSIFLELHSGRRLLADANVKLADQNRQLQVLAEKERAAAAESQRANTALKVAYQELQATQAQLVQSAKMASLGTLVAGIAHEVNNPLAFISSHLGTIRSSLHGFFERVHDVDPEAKERWDRALLRLDQASDGVERIRDLVLKLQTFSRIDQGERKKVRISECLDSVLTIVNHRTKGIDVQVDVAADDEVDCHPSLLNQALMNLITNAIDAVDGQGQIVIRAAAQGEQYVLSVSDDGPGIPPEIHDRIVEPFFTTKPVGKGTGLGLSITFTIAEKHGGSLAFDKRPGGGTIATLRIPR